MTPNFVTTPTFVKSMKNIDKRFELVDKRFDSTEKMIRDCMEEQRNFFVTELDKRIGETNARIDVFIEHFDEKFRILLEHPLFANYKA